MCGQEEPDTNRAKKRSFLFLLGLEYTGPGVIMPSQPPTFVTFAIRVTSLNFFAVTREEVEHFLRRVQRTGQELVQQIFLLLRLKSVLHVLHNIHLRENRGDVAVDLKSRRLMTRR